MLILFSLLGSGCISILDNKEKNSGFVIVKIITHDRKPYTINVYIDDHKNEKTVETDMYDNLELNLSKVRAGNHTVHLHIEVSEKYWQEIDDTWELEKNITVFRNQESKITFEIDLDESDNDIG